MTLSATMLAAVAAGGACGAVARYLVGIATLTALGPGFPLATILVNVIGSFAMGALVAAAALRFDMPPELRGLLAVGFLGAFTTFSTFSLDAVTLFERGRWLAAASYVTISVVLSIAALIAGLTIVRKLAATD